jgi:hypothetical protein
MKTLELFKKTAESKIFKIILWGILGFIVLLIVFKAGMAVGFKKASFSYKWGENYHRNFGGPKKGLLEDFSGRDFLEGYGTFGQIIKIDDLTLVIDGRGDMEKIILIKEDTVIKRFRDNIKLSDLKVDDYVTVIGEPNEEGQIQAKLIRLSPPRPPMRAPFKP